MVSLFSAISISPARNGWVFAFYRRILLLMRWLIAAVVLLALAVLYLVHRTNQIEHAAKPGVHPIAATIF